MANQFTTQVLKDTTTSSIIKLTGFFDGLSGDEANNYRVQANTLYGALDANNVPLRSGLSKSNTAQSYYGLAIDKIWFEANFSGTGHARLFWNATTAKTIASTHSRVFDLGFLFGSSVFFRQKNIFIVVIN